MSLVTLPGTAKRASLTELLLQLKITGNLENLTWISITVHEDIDANTGTYRPKTANLWVSQEEFDTMVWAFAEGVRIPISLTYDDSTTVNNVRLFCYLAERVEFTSVAQVYLQLGSNTDGAAAQPS
jgi:hypothetical protein